MMAQENPKSVPEVLRETWLAALGAFSFAENEAKKIGERLSKIGIFSPKEREKILKEIRKRIEKNRKLLEAKIEEGIDKALHRLRIPTQKEIKNLQARVNALSKKVEANSKRKPTSA